MDPTFKLTVNEALQFDLTKVDLAETDLLEVSENTFHALEGHRSYNVRLVTSDFLRKRYVLTVNETRYEVAIADDLDVLIQEMGFALSETESVTAIEAPMPGLILEINVTAGQEVKENDTLLILEAMKMENSIVSPRDGLVKCISVAPGDTVEKNQVLIEFE
ncbi:acetyl-CoA carboxylase biotin carboxyl carrier protein subunit [Maribacter sp. 2-571]|uniref:acetyl-CoA carboxylase biotin carboxyl carrier protein subunit n=1 Tax=Maribacter sp. 2-571 TaxID=3417569 RepID=UPI003D35445A